jgi:arylsulfatase A-like enzyme
VTKRPNVLVIMADQMKATSSHLYGSTFCTTPGLARLAERGVRFETAITPQPLCVPARVSLWTAQWPHAHGARRNETPMPPGREHAFRIWREAGYHTALIGKDHCFVDADDVAGFDVRCELGHLGRPHAGPPVGMPWVVDADAIDAAHALRRAMPRQGPAVSYAVSDADPAACGSGVVAAQTVAWLEERTRHDQPFAAWISFPDPHTPYEVPRAWAETVPPESVELPTLPDPEQADIPERMRVLQRLLDVRDASEAHRRGLVATYHAMVRFVDDGVGRILDALERTGLERDTIVVFCADHGDFALEHGLSRKGGAFYDCLVRVPLIVSWPPHVPSGVRDDSPVNLIDVVPTLLTLQGLPVPAAMQGRPLPSVTAAPAREATFSEYGAGGPACTLADLDRLGLGRGLDASKATLAWREAEGRRKLVRTRRWSYATDPTGDIDELYDLERDPGQLRNLARQPGAAETVAHLRSLLLAWLVQTEDAVPVPLPPPTTVAADPRGSTA